MKIVSWKYLIQAEKETIYVGKRHPWTMDLYVRCLEKMKKSGLPNGVVFHGDYYYGRIRKEIQVTDDDLI